MGLSHAAVGMGGFHGCCVSGFGFVKGFVGGIGMGWVAAFEEALKGGEFD